MRTAIFLGLISIGGAIESLVPHDPPSDIVVNFMGVILIVMMAMDIVDFLNNSILRNSK